MSAGGESARISKNRRGAIWRAALFVCLIIPLKPASAQNAASAAPLSAAPAAPRRLEFYGPLLDPKRKFINSGVIKPKITPPKPQILDFPPFSTAVTVPKFFDSRERLPRADLSGLSRLRFLTSADFFPFNYVDGNQNLAGYHVDLARALCAELQLENICSIAAAPWEELETRLQAGEADALIAGLASTAQNRAYLSFSHAYMRFPARFLGRADSKIARDSENFLRLDYDFSEFLRLRSPGLRTGVIGGSAHEKMLRDYFAARPLAESSRNAGHAMQFVPFANQAALIAALKAGQVDLAFGDGFHFALLLNAQRGEKDRLIFMGGAYPGIGYLGQGLRLAAAKNAGGAAAQLIPAFNYALQQLERKGKLAELYLRYFPIGFY